MMLAPSANTLETAEYEYDTKNGAHINAWAGKNKGLGVGEGGLHYKFNASQDTVRKIQGSFFCK